MTTELKLYKNLKTLEQRKDEAMRILSKYPDRVPVIVDPANIEIQEKLLKRKYLVPKDLTVGQFMQVLRKHTNMKIDASEAVFLFVDNVLPATAQMMGVIYEQQKSEDKFLTLVISKESTFG